MAKREKPALTLDEHRALGAELHAMSERLSALAHDLGERYAARIVTKVLRAMGDVDDVRAALDSVLWTEQRATSARATLDVVYFPPGALAAVPVADAATKAGPA